MSTKDFREIVRRLVADYMASEGCGCCGDYEQHKIDKAALAEILKVPPHPEQADYFPFDGFRSKGR